MRRWTMVVLVSFGLLIAASPLLRAVRGNGASGQTSGSKGSVKDRFLGTWKLVSIERRGANGERLPQPAPPALGSQDRIGFLIYELSGKRLTLKPPLAQVDGQDVQGVITWERVSADADRGR